MSDRKASMLRKILAGLHHSGLAQGFRRFGFSKHLGVILTFHHVRKVEPRDFDPNAHLTVAPDFFETVIEYCKRSGHEFVSLDEARARIKSGKSKKHFVAFTFDDGYRNNLEIAAPIMRKHGVPYTVFVATGFIDRTADLWWEGLEELVRQEQRLQIQLPNGPVDLNCEGVVAKRNSYQFLLNYIVCEHEETAVQDFVRHACASYQIDLDAIREDLMMTWEEIATLQSDPLCTIGAHTLTHPALARLNEEQAENEIRGSAMVLADKIGTHPRHFAFPFGTDEAASSREFNLAKRAGYSTAVTTRPGMIYSDHAEHLFGLPRVSVNGLYQNISYYAPLMSGLPTRMLNGGKRLHY